MIFELQDQGVVRFTGGAENFIRAYTSNTIDRPQNAFLDLHGRIVAVFFQKKVSECEILAVLGKAYLSRLEAHLEKYLKISGVSLERVDKQVYLSSEKELSVLPEDSLRIALEKGEIFVTSQPLDASGTWEDFTRFRLRSNLPWQGTDFDQEVLLNVDREKLVSFTKGCYLGQEIIARIQSRTGPSKTLEVCYEDMLEESHKQILTSRTLDPATGRAMGFVFMDRSKCHLASSERQERIRTNLEKIFSPIFLKIEDESHFHAGHRDAGDATHFSIEIVSDAFEGKALLERHRAVQRALQQEFSAGLHALKLKTFSPAEHKKKVK